MSVDQTFRLESVYRECSLGQSLNDELQSQVNQQKITKEEAMKCADFFDKMLAQGLEDFQKQTDRIEGRIDGKIDMYRYCDNTWVLECSDVKTTYASMSHMQTHGPKETPFLHLKATEAPKKQRSRPSAP